MSSLIQTIIDNMSARITTLELGTMDNFIHFITDNDTKNTFIVDPAWDFSAIQQHIVENHFIVKGVVLTHSHGDHISALSQAIHEYQVPIYISESEYKLGRVKEEVTLLQNNDTIDLGNSIITVLETPGHTSGSVCYHIDQHLITGDTIFIDGCGVCTFVESDVEALWHSLQQLKQLPDETILYVGHNYGRKKTDTLGNQKQTNPYLLIDNKDFFMDFRMNLQSTYRSIPFAPSSLEEINTIRSKHQ